MASLRERALSYYKERESVFDLLFFLGGFLFDVVTLSEVDSWFSLGQQIFFLASVGLILYFKTTALPQEAGDILSFKGKIWAFHDPVLHFMLGGLLSTYSLFFLKSSSVSASLLFVFFLMILMAANEMSGFRRRMALKSALYFVCVFCFMSMVYPLALGFVGLTPFLLAFLTTLVLVASATRLIHHRVSGEKAIKDFGAPGGVVALVFLVLYLFGMIPPVPVSIHHLGVYHSVERVNGGYEALHEQPWWRFWSLGDQDFRAEPGDRIFFFTRIFSPSRFDDSVVIHWQQRDADGRWSSTDRIPMRIRGGRREGYRGFTVKQNYSSGDWRILVETTDGREIGRIRFKVTQVLEASTGRRFERISL